MRPPIYPSLNAHRNKVVLTVAAALVAGGVMLLYFRPHPKHRGGEPAPAAFVSSSVQASAAPASSALPHAANRPEHSPLADELHAATFDERHDLVVLHGLLGQLTTSLRLAERPPLGDNADIAAALTGRNRRRIVFVPPIHPALRDGLLVDRRGVPYHFHARSADAIDVRAAGADGVLFTGDDLVVDR